MFYRLLKKKSSKHNIIEFQYKDRSYVNTYLRQDIYFLTHSTVWQCSDAVDKEYIVAVAVVAVVAVVVVAVVALTAASLV